MKIKGKGQIVFFFFFDEFYREIHNRATLVWEGDLIERNVSRIIRIISACFLKHLSLGQISNSSFAKRKYAIMLPINYRDDVY